MGCNNDSSIKKNMKYVFFYLEYFRKIFIQSKKVLYWLYAYFVVEMTWENPWRTPKIADAIRKDCECVAIYLDLTPFYCQRTAGDAILFSLAH